MKRLLNTILFMFLLGITAFSGCYEDPIDPRQELIPMDSLAGTSWLCTDAWGPSSLEFISNLEVLSNGSYIWEYFYNASTRTGIAGSSRFDISDDGQKLIIDTSYGHTRDFIKQ